MRLAGHVARMRDVYNIYVGKPQGSRSQFGSQVRILLRAWMCVCVSLCCVVLCR
jgi:hypothetical protein